MYSVPYRATVDCTCTYEVVCSPSIAFSIFRLSSIQAFETNGRRSTSLPPEHETIRLPQAQNSPRKAR